MKHITSRILLVVTVALCVVAAQAQSTTMMMKGNVPFDFMVGDRSLPAGEYTIRALDQEIEAWYDPNGRGLFIVKTLPMGAEDELGSTKLVFRRYGDQYFLVQVWNNGVSHEVKVGSNQRRIAKSQKFETVAVLMTSHR